ncbi:glycoside hydrolase family 5 protein, partial [Patescibacteria group bacterium]|nr:glycoside hydrolase family 5 protein [Patescibacteria group bacterium]
MKFVTALVFLFCFFVLFITPSYAIVDPLASPNNKFGIHILSTTPDEASPAATLVNSSGGDWGYVTVLVESKDRNHDKWQSFFDDLRRRHLIPLVRIATQPDGGNWKRPYEGEEVAWADFLDNLVWPTKNRYVIIYNEPNHGQEWDGSADPTSYANVLDKTITALKNKNSDFFVLNAGFDASAPGQLPKYSDEAWYLSEMNKTVPGIFNKLDGWVSHSYPNPGFVGLPTDTGRGTINGWQWELNFLKSMGVHKNLPIFITETGWRHAEGLNFDKSLPSSDTVAEYMQQAYSGPWSNNQIVAVTPFLLNYQEEPFDHFSFKKITGEKQNIKILGASYPEYYSSYQTMVSASKTLGLPVQDRKAEVVHGGIYNSLVTGEKYDVPITFKNTGEAIWGER